MSVLAFVDVRLPRWQRVISRSATDETAVRTYRLIHHRPEMVIFARIDFDC